MNVSVLEETFAKGLSIVSKAVESKPYLPVLSNVLLETEDARLKLAATNLEMSIVCWIGAKVNQAGAITLPYKTFSDLVNRLPEERVDLTLNAATQTVNVKCGATVGNVKGIDAAEFPIIPEYSGDWVELPADHFSKAIRYTTFAAANEDYRPILSGVCVTFGDDFLELASADGYRLSVARFPVDAVPQSLRGCQYVVPADTLEAALKVIEGEVKVGFTYDKVFISVPNVLIGGQLLEGKFPDYAAIIPRNHITEALVYTDDLLAMLQRAEIFSRDSAFAARMHVKMTSEINAPGSVTVTGKSAERGDAETEVPADVDGDPVDINFNVKYMLDLAKKLEVERIALEFNGQANPIVIRPTVDTIEFTALVMPMSVTR